MATQDLDELERAARRPGPWQYVVLELIADVREARRMAVWIADRLGSNVVLHGSDGETIEQWREELG